LKDAILIRGRLSQQVVAAAVIVVIEQNAHKARWTISVVTIDVLK